MSAAPRVVVVHRRTELEELVDRHATRGQVEFFLRSRGRDLGEVQARHDASAAALDAVAAGIPSGWRRGRVERTDLDRFWFDPLDIIVAVGQDGLVANVAKYLAGQPVIGVNPELGRNPGVLVPHVPDAVARLLPDVAAGLVAMEMRTLVEAVTDDGLALRALNEVFVGHPSHQSARYSLAVPDGRVERQSSSGLLVGTGTGSTGWLASAALERGSGLRLPAPCDGALAWFSREPWPSPTTGASLTEGVVTPGQELAVVVEQDAMVVFGDGVESDRLRPTWGQTIRVRAAAEHLAFVGPQTGG